MLKIAIIINLVLQLLLHIDIIRKLRAIELCTLFSIILSIVLLIRL